MFIPNGTEMPGNQFLLSLLWHFLYSSFFIEVSTIKTLCSTLYFIFINNNNNNLHHNTNYLCYTVLHIHRQEQVEFITHSFWMWTVLQTSWNVWLRIENCYVSECVRTKLPGMRHTQPDNTVIDMGFIFKWMFCITEYYLYSVLAKLITSLSTKYLRFITMTLPQG